MNSKLFQFEQRLFYLLVCWDIIYLPLSINFLRHKLNIDGINLKSFLSFGYHYVLAPANTANGWGPSWYLVGMLMGLPLFILLKRLLHSDIILGIIGVIVEIYYVLANEFG